jgi:formylmethanofuran dehydrogenase subunit C
VTEIVLTLRGVLTGTVDLSCIVPDQLATRSNVEIGNLLVWSSAAPRKPLPLGEVFRIDGERAPQVRIQGDCRQAEGLGRDMRGGRLEIEGNAGADCGIAMQGGIIRVTGDAGLNLGGALPGASRGMTGGEIVVLGSAEGLAGARMRRGLIFVGGTSGELAGRGMIAGTLVLGGPAGARPAEGVKRGTVVALGTISPPAGFRYACTYRPPVLPLILTRLRTGYGASISEQQVQGTYRRYSGDMAELGKGEILEWVKA